MLRRKPDGTWEFLQLEQMLASARPMPLSSERKDVLRLRIMSQLGAQDPPPQPLLSLGRARWVAVPAGIGLAAAIIAATQVLPQDSGSNDELSAPTYAYAKGSILVDGKVSFRAAPGELVQATSVAWLAVGADVEVGIQSSSSLRYFRNDDGSLLLEHYAGDLFVASTGQNVRVEAAGYGANALPGTVVKFAHIAGGTWVEVAEGSLVLQVGGESLTLRAGDTYFIPDAPEGSGNRPAGDGGSNPGHGGSNPGNGGANQPGGPGEGSGAGNGASNGNNDDGNGSAHEPGTNNGHHGSENNGNGNGPGSNNGNGPGEKNDPLAEDPLPPRATPTPHGNPSPGTPPAHSNAGGSHTATPPPPPAGTPQPPVVPPGPPETSPGHANTPPPQSEGSPPAHAGTPGPPPHSSSPTATPTPPAATPTATPPSNSGNPPEHSNAGGNGAGSSENNGLGPEANDGVGPDGNNGLGPEVNNGVGPEANNGVGPDVNNGVGPDGNNGVGPDGNNGKAPAHSNAGGNGKATV